MLVLVPSRSRYLDLAAGMVGCDRAVAVFCVVIPRKVPALGWSLPVGGSTDTTSSFSSLPFDEDDGQIRWDSRSLSGFVSKHTPCKRPPGSTRHAVSSMKSWPFLGLGVGICSESPAAQGIVSSSRAGHRVELKTRVQSVLRRLHADHSLLQYK